MFGSSDKGRCSALQNEYPARLGNLPDNHEGSKLADSCRLSPSSVPEEQAIEPPPGYGCACFSEEGDRVTLKPHTRLLREGEGRVARGQVLAKGLHGHQIVTSSCRLGALRLPSSTIAAPTSNGS
jgi:hypothetical protein